MYTEVLLRLCWRRERGRPARPRQRGGESPGAWRAGPGGCGACVGWRSITRSFTHYTPPARALLLRRTSCIHQQKVVCGHGDPLEQRDARLVREGAEVALDIPVPPARVARTQRAVKVGVALGGVLASGGEGPVDAQAATVCQDARRASKQTLGHHPRRDVAHIGDDHRIKALWLELSPVADAGAVVGERRLHVVEALGPSRNGAKRIGREVGWAEADAGQRRGEVGDVLSRAAGDLERPPGRRQNRQILAEDRGLVSIA
mmetsp:Transcript_43166/g.140635  ORF Transcript_43166/g.140635 Transcript_43166/m.140635 type:complete len:260 (+) Transcript_43166:22-801(+)